ncbi:hypothetical protein RRG08_060401, partial [Elysia crispata]
MFGVKVGAFSSRRGDCCGLIERENCSSRSKSSSPSTPGAGEAALEARTRRRAKWQRLEIP